MSHGSVLMPVVPAFQDSLSVMSGESEFGFDTRGHAPWA